MSISIDPTPRRRKRKYTNPLGSTWSSPDKLGHQPGVDGGIPPGTLVLIRCRKCWENVAVQKAGATLGNCPTCGKPETYIHAKVGRYY
jgi:hypothetical protein